MQLIQFFDFLTHTSHLSIYSIIMMSFDFLTSDVLILALASLIAGLVDAMVGGGGLIMLPALFSVHPQLPHAVLIGTNKIASICGTTSALIKYSKTLTIPWRWVLPTTIACFIGAFLGAYTLTLLSPTLLKKALPILLLLVLIYTIKKKNFGHKQKNTPKHAQIIGISAGLVLGFYDGFFGPGTGSFLIFVFIYIFGLDFLLASSSAKVANIACNLAALMLFGYKGNLWWQLGLILAVMNIIGAQIGSHLALKHGTQLIRKVFLVLVSTLTGKTFYDAYLR